MYLAANDSAARIGRVKAIPFGQEMLQRPALRRKDVANWTVPAFQCSGWRRAMRPLTAVLNPAFLVRAGHSRPKIGQVKPCPRDGDGQRVPRVQTEKPHAGLSAARHICSDIQLRESREPRQRRCPAQTDASHAKWNDCQPGLPFKCVDLQLRRKKRTECGNVDRPVRKEQVMPALRHHPRSCGKRPRPVRDFL